MKVFTSLSDIFAHFFILFPIVLADLLHFIKFFATFPNYSIHRKFLGIYKLTP